MCAPGKALDDRRDSQTILALNDSPDLLALYTDLLEEVGYRVSAWQHLNGDLPAIVELAPDLIILDYIWGSEHAGWQLLKDLKADPRMRETPVVLCTAAFKQLAPIQARLDEMHVQVVPKPFDIDHLLQVVTTALDEAAPAA